MVNLDVEVAQDVAPRPDELLSVRIAKGILKIDQKKTQRHTYTIKSSSAEKKTVLVELPIDAAWELATPKQRAEKTRDLYRFEAVVEASEARSH